MDSILSNNKSITSHSYIDITSDSCPMTFVKTKIRLEKMQSGEVLEVLLNEGEPLKNVPLSAKELGHSILQEIPQEDGKTYLLFIQKA
jgi:TusA-related sulfurtransferase